MSLSSLSVSVSVCLNAFAQFSRYRSETLQVGRGRPGTGRGGDKIVGVLLRGGGLGRERVEEAVGKGRGLGLGCCKGPGNAGQPN